MANTMNWYQKSLNMLRILTDEMLFFSFLYTHTVVNVLNHIYISQICSSSVALLVGPPLCKTYFNQKLLEEVKEELFPCSTSFCLLAKILQTKISNVLIWCK